jgi:hypothetical protein
MSDALANTLASTSLNGDNEVVDVDPATLQPLSPEVISKQATSKLFSLTWVGTWVGVAKGKPKVGEPGGEDG